MLDLALENLHCPSFSDAATAAAKGETVKGVTKFESMDEVRGLFDPVERTDFTMNWLFCSTSGIHGSYLTIVELEEYFADPDRFDREDNGGEAFEPSLTVLIVKPRVVQIGYGDIQVTKADLPYLRDLVSRTLAGVAKSQEENL